MDMIKIVSALKQEAIGKRQLPETKRFKIWKYVAVTVGMGLNTVIGLLFFKVNAFVPGITFLFTWNVMTLAFLVVAKFLRYLSKYYRYIYLVTAIWPIMTLIVYMGLGFLALKWMSTW